MAAVVRTLVVPQASCRKRHAQVQASLAASNEATLVRRRWLDADDARGRDAHAEADLGRIRLADARYWPPIGGLSRSR
ncbi:hypothetical protein Xbuh_06675 [Xanthomonas axonopodis pv. bauhiniae]|nr:hypothetical protein Xmar_15800 [Xanthomonas axonopodis pv. martyniicola]OOW92849.1 hypothetical protein Xvtr_15460 [Xanthomonas campestris pv. vitiscarnosae]OOX20087.1 hypothetical protein Xbuh_06675 [Xanthomonas axonopodis pv. bauhiniae]